MCVAKWHLCWHLCPQITVCFTSQMTLTVLGKFENLLQCQVSRANFNANGLSIEPKALSVVSPWAGSKKHFKIVLSDQCGRSCACLSTTACYLCRLFTGGKAGKWLTPTRKSNQEDEAEKTIPHLRGFLVIWLWAFDSCGKTVSSIKKMSHVKRNIKIIYSCIFCWLTVHFSNLLPLVTLWYHSFFLKLV